LPSGTSKVVAAKGSAVAALSAQLERQFLRNELSLGNDGVQANEVLQAAVERVQHGKEIGLHVALSSGGSVLSGAAWTHGNGNTDIHCVGSLRKGHGTHWMDRIEAEAANSGSSVVWLRTSPEFVGFFGSRGYEPVGGRQTAEGEVRMALKLPKQKAVGSLDGSSVDVGALCFPDGWKPKAQVVTRRSLLPVVKLTQ
jgi:hypothetical protein